MIHKYIFAIFLILIFNTLIYANKDLIDRYIENKEDGKAYALVSKEIENGKDLYRNYYIMAKMHEGGWGVEKNFKKAYYYYVLASEHGSRLASRRIAQAYFSGQGFTEQNVDKAVYWFRKAALQSDTESMRWFGLSRASNADGKDFFNFLVASKWINYAASKGDEKAKQIIYESPELKKTDTFYKLRVYNSIHKPYEKVFLGIVLGERFADELLVPKGGIKRPYVKNSSRYFNDYRRVGSDYANKNSGYLENLLNINVSTTKYSNIVYEIDAKYQFDTMQECKKFQKKYFSELFSKSSSKSTPIKTVTLKSEIQYVDFGTHYDADGENPYWIDNIDKLKGIRHLSSCINSDNSSKVFAYITLNDFNAMKLKIAEIAKYEDEFSYMTRKSDDAYEYEKLFGITLGETIPKNIRKNKISDEMNSYNIYTFTPSYTKEPFTTYKVYTSLITDTVFKIEAEGYFTNSFSSEYKRATKNMDYSMVHSGEYTSEDIMRLTQSSEYEDGLKDVFFKKYNKRSNYKRFFENDAIWVDPIKGSITDNGYPNEKHQVRFDVKSFGKDENWKLQLELYSGYAKNMAHNEYLLLRR